MLVKFLFHDARLHKKFRLLRDVLSQISLKRLSRDEACSGEIKQVTYFNFERFRNTFNG